jgi:hypothetical protein
MPRDFYDDDVDDEDSFDSDDEMAEHMGFSYFDDFDPYDDAPDEEQVLSDLMVAIDDDGYMTTSGKKKHSSRRMDLDSFTGVRDITPVVNRHSDEGILPLTLACRVGSASTVSSILSNGANIELADDDGTTCFMATACNDKDEKYAVEIMKMLLRDEKPSMKLLNACDKEGNTALIHAAKEGKFKLVKLLASRKRINPNIENEKSDSALSYAVRHSLEMVKVLLDAGAVVTGNSGAIALLHARAAKPEVMEALLDSRSDWGRVKGDELLLMYVSMNEGGEELIKRVQAKVLECAEGASDEADADDIASAPDAKTGKSSASGKKRKR